MPSRVTPLPKSDRFPAPAILAIETSDFESMAQAFLRWDHRFEQLDRGRFHGALRFLDLDGVQLFDCAANLVIRCRGGRAPDSFTFSPIQPANADALWRGRVLRPGMVNLAGPGQETDHRTCVNYRHTAISVRRDLLDRVARGLLGVGHEELLGPRALEIGPARADQLTRTWRRLLRRPIGAVDSAPRLDPLEFAVDLVRVLADGRVVAPHRLTPARRLHAVRRAEEFARSRPRGRVSVLDLCECTGLSERGLHDAFVEVTGLAPKAYLTALRLNQARHDLRAAGRDRGRVAPIAHRYGFDRPGDFAAAYRRQFGELPSQT
jgi:AraC-like DNA-binding protein